MVERHANPDEPLTVSLTDEEGVKRIVVDSIFGLWEIVNNLTRLQPSKPERYRVTIFGSSRAKPGMFAYEETKRMAAALTELGCDIITGGGPGLMQAANEGAALADGDGRTQSVGIRVNLPFEQGANPFVEKVFEHRTFFTRLHNFVLASDAFIVAPGGIGSTLETAMIWQLLQVRHLHDVPLVLVGRMWADFVAWAREHMLGGEVDLASPKDLDIPDCVPGADEAIALIRSHHARWLAAKEARDS